MKDFFSLSYFFLFLKFQLTVSDSSYFYLVTNIVGAILLYYVLKSKAPKGFVFYLGMFMGNNILLLGLRLLDISVAGIPLSSFPSVVFSIFILVCYLYNFFYPLISFTELIKAHGNRTVQRLLKTMAFLSALLMLTFYLLPQLTPLLMFTIIVGEFVSLIKVYKLA